MKNKLIWTLILAVVFISAQSFVTIDKNEKLNLNSLDDYTTVDKLSLTLKLKEALSTHDVDFLNLALKNNKELVINIYKDYQSTLENTQLQGFTLIGFLDRKDCLGPALFYYIIEEDDTPCNYNAKSYLSNTNPIRCIPCEDD